MEPISSPEEAGRDAALPTWLENWTELFVTSLGEYAVFAIGLDGTLLTWQRGVETVLGFSREAFVGRHAAMIFTDSDRAAGAPDLELSTALQGGQALDELPPAAEELARDVTLFGTYDEAGDVIAAWFAAGADDVNLVLPPGRPEAELQEFLDVAARS